MKNLLVVSMGVLAVLSSCTVKVKTQDNKSYGQSIILKSKPVQGDATGLAYALPKTGLRFIVKAEKVEKKRGDFYLYSERYLGLKDVVLEDGVEWNVKSIELEPYAEANSDETYQIEIVGANAIPNISLLQNGVITGVNTDAACCKEPAKEVVKSVEKQSNVPYTEEMLLANSSSKMAYEAARYIYRLRENRTALLSAESEVLPPDGEAYAMSLEQIDVLENQFVSLFKGTEKSTIVTEVIEIMPEDLIKRGILFRFSAFSGVVAADDLSGKPYFVTMQGEKVAKNEALPDSAGLYYKQPLDVKVSVLEGNTEILSEKVLMGQFGRLSALPLGLLTKETKVVFYPSTGGIKTIGN